MGSIGDRLLFETGYDKPSSQNKSATPFIVDEANKEIISQLCFYLSGDNRFEKNLHKGLLLRGDIGTGKTFLMKVLKEMLSYSGKNMHVVPAVKISEAYSRSDTVFLSKLENGIICIDDMGSEEPEIKSFGSTIRPVYEVLSKRYIYNRLTFITTNLKPSEIELRYGNRIRDRLKEMCNDYKLTGKSRRQ